MLNYPDRLPLEWVPGATPEVDEKQRITTNLYLLEAVSAIEEHSLDRISEEQPELHQELHRLDAKLHLLLDMVARLLRSHDRLPRSRAVRVAVELIEIEAGGADMVVGAEGVLHLHLHPAIPAALLLPGRITGTARDEDGEWLQFQPGELSDPELEALSRHVFRHHRRNIAAARQGSTPA
ncbi:PilZ domain-containing protein [Haliea sp.]